MASAVSLPFPGVESIATESHGIERKSVKRSTTNQTDPTEPSILLDIAAQDPFNAVLLTLWKTRVEKGAYLDGGVIEQIEFDVERRRVPAHQCAHTHLPKEKPPT